MRPIFARDKLRMRVWREANDRYLLLLLLSGLFQRRSRESRLGWQFVADMIHGGNL